MLSNILANIGQTLHNRVKLSDLDMQKVLDFISNYRTGLWLYPGVFKRKTRISMVQIYEILKCLEEENIIESYYELYCSSCQKSSGIVVKAFNEIPETFECEMCHEELSGIENAVLIYKVIQG